MESQNFKMEQINACIYDILTRNKRRCSWFRNSVSLACWS